MNRNKLIKQVKSILQDTFGERLKGVVLYGSEARGGAPPDSDIDFLVLLDRQPREPEDSWACINALYPLLLELGRTIHAEPVDLADYEAGEFPLYQTASREGIFL